LATSVHAKAFFQNASNVVSLFCHSRKAQPQAGTFFVIPAKAGTFTLPYRAIESTFPLPYRAI
jgi:hypothetical protein